MQSSVDRVSAFSFGCFFLTLSFFFFLLFASFFRNFRRPDARRDVCAFPASTSGETRATHVVVYTHGVYCRYRARFVTQRFSFLIAGRARARRCKSTGANSDGAVAIVEIAVCRDEYN